MPKMVWFNGELSPLDEAKIPAADHAHLYGDGIFEGIRIYDRKVFKLDEHLDRLFNGCRFMGFKMTMSKEDVREAVLRTCAAADFDDGYVRLNVTRGTALGLDPRAVKGDPNVMVMVSSLTLYPSEAYEKGLDVITCSIRTISPDALDPRLKCIGRYASNILAKMEANVQGAGEGLLLNPQGRVAECTGDNVFAFLGEKLLTPSATEGILKGITRDTAIDLARELGFHVEEGQMTRYDLLSADEAFLTGTAAEVIPMVSLDGRQIGTGRPGPRTQQLMAAFHDSTKDGAAF